MPQSIARSDFHAEQLELACLRALAAGKVDEAFRNIDRRCRISPLPRAHHFVLRAETLSRMGDGKSEPLEHADPAEHATPDKSRAIRSASARSPGNEIFSVCGSAAARRVLSTRGWAGSSRSRNRSRSRSTFAQREFISRHAMSSAAASPTARATASVPGRRPRCWWPPHK